LGVKEAVAVFASYARVSRRVSAVSYSALLAFEGFAWFLGEFGTVTRPGGTASGWYTTLDCGPLRLLIAAILVTDSSSIHAQTTSYYITSVLKTLYPLYSVALSLFAFLSQSLLVSHRQWIAARVTIIIFWICVSIPEFMWWKIDELPFPELPGIQFREDSSIGSPSSSVSSESGNKSELSDEWSDASVTNEQLSE
jgi:hypothetical protein